MSPVHTLPEGEGTDRVAIEKYIDVKYRAELRFKNHADRLPLPWERAGVRGWIYPALQILIQKKPPDL
jgi:hypothetical protein